MQEALEVPVENIPQALKILKQEYDAKKITVGHYAKIKRILEGRK